MLNTMVRNQPGLDDRLSGTTAATVMLNEGMAYIANTGDSRIVLGTADKRNKVIAVDLSHDQTPFRADERQRVKAAGARVLTSREKNGDVKIASAAEYTADDPPRCYLQKFNVPGTAFTRSIGDSVAESVGVIATPEVRTHKINDTDRFIIIASDGVWEFLSSQEAVDIVVACSNPQQAASKLLTAAYELWTDFDLRVDDISAIVIFFDYRKKDPSERGAAVLPPVRGVSKTSSAKSRTSC